MVNFPRLKYFYDICTLGYHVKLSNAGHSFKKAGLLIKNNKLFSLFESTALILCMGKKCIMFVKQVLKFSLDHHLKMDSDLVIKMSQN